METGRRYFEKIIKLIEILNETKDENGISRITKNELKNELKIGNTNINNLIREINKEEIVITRFKEWYKIKVKNIYEIKRFEKMIRIIEELIKNPNELFENEIKISQKYEIERNELQRIKTIIKLF